MAPKLYVTDASPPSRSVLMVAAALKVDIVKVEVNLLNMEHLTPEYLKKNPLHTIPLLEDGNFLLVDSHAIVAYLVNTYAKNDALYPEDPKKRALVDSKLHFDDSILFPRGKSVIKSLLLYGETEIPKAKLDDIVEAYGMMEAFLVGEKWVTGDQPSLADYCCITSIGAMDIIVPVSNITFPRLAGWIKRCYSLPFYMELGAPGDSKLRNVIESKMNRT